MLCLRQRTGILRFAVFVCSSVEDTFPVEYVDNEDTLERFLSFMFPAVNPTSFVQAFDVWSSSQSSGKFIDAL